MTDSTVLGVSTAIQLCALGHTCSIEMASTATGSIARSITEDRVKYAAPRLTLSSHAVPSKPPRLKLKARRRTVSQEWISSIKVVEYLKCLYFATNWFPVQTPERIEFSNLSTHMSSDQEDSLSQMDEDEWTDRNFGASTAEVCSSDNEEDSSSSR